MNASTITVHWHDENQPVYSLNFQPNARGERAERLVTGGGDNNVRMWRPVYSAAGNKIVSVEYLCTLPKHTQAVNVVRFDPKGETLASAGDDGTVLLWTRADAIVREFGSEDDDAQESWVVRHALRSPQSEIYDLAWSPDGQYVLTGSMDNVTRIYNAATGQQVSQLAEHSHYVQGVTWDPRNEYIATQSADRSVHVYALKHTNGVLTVAPTTFYKSSRAEMPTARLSQLLPTPAPTPVVPTSMLPPTHKRKLSGSFAPRASSQLRAVSPLPAVRAMEPMRNSLLYHSETLQSFFRRLVFSPDGSLLLTPSGIFKTKKEADSDDKGKEEEETPKYEETNTVYIYTRAGLNKPPVAHLPGMKKPALAVSFSPVIYKLRAHPAATVHVQVDAADASTTAHGATPDTRPMFDLPYRMVFAVITQDLVIVYDTQQRQPLGLVTNLHYSTFTDVSWNSKGDTIMISSTDGFCSAVVFEPETMGEVLYLHGSDAIQAHSSEPQAQPKAQSKDRGRAREKINVVDILEQAGKRHEAELNHTIEMIDVVTNLSVNSESSKTPETSKSETSEQSENSENYESSSASDMASTGFDKSSAAINVSKSATSESVEVSDVGEAQDHRERVKPDKKKKRRIAPTLLPQ
ncbi:hypothetical protein BABINDRAFT_158909 [Babjeviella inositovora NRRL Y-12698]|uniref:CAF1B/HIR1 beta-propeller domain-containing protein n=1 Tax=Babjeviella inositovora NRRL Y-12698 TaxID=984486 RepID=A0A1E3QXL2_9ASCO|nr:uncharacterized protein BABINDRAFT_158909 [Babjeviella inositovora NRRL Y-12698]ODQ82284.1 hypothetical protein BABINDRAFT_158909 [Babjeviella inositovora NRRL Y-12698]